MTNFIKNDHQWTNSITNDHPWSYKWVQKMKDDSKWENIRLKILAPNPSLHLPDNLYDLVDYDEFIKPEENRLALFVGTQFFVAPSREMFEKSKHLVAKLDRAGLSGVVAGLGIYNHSMSEKPLAYFKND